MCGIVGYVGEGDAAPTIFECLSRLEYRGYDSAGMALLGGDGHIALRRKEGKLDILGELLEKRPLSGTVGIGHTRWATHGAAVERNAHPQVCGKVAVVHNGVIENYAELKEELRRRGCSFASDTDTEVIPQLINSYLSGGMQPLEAVRAATGRLQGSFALAILFEGSEKFLIAARKNSPLVIGFGKEGESILVASDELALAPVAKSIIHLEDGDIAVITQTNAMIYGEGGKPVRRETEPVTSFNYLASMNGYRHFMQKEIFEQPTAIMNTLGPVVSSTNRTVLPLDLPFDPGTLSRVWLIGCGTAAYAGLVARHWFEALAGIPAEWEVASEFRYRNAPLSRREAGIFISQSGETADTLAALRSMQEKDCPTLAVVNVGGSTIARTGDAILRTHAGPEIGVASTKAFTAQLVALAALAIKAARARKKMTLQSEMEFVGSLLGLPGQIQSVLGFDAEFKEIAGELAVARNIFYIGRGTNCAVAMEGALKMKEVSYIHAEAYTAGELKHGPLALIDNNVPVVVVAPRDEWFAKTASNMQEVVARGGKVLLLSDKEGCAALSRDAWKCVEMPFADTFAAPVLYAVAVQLLAYHAAVCRGTDIDQPRNLAKSVTVE